MPSGHSINISTSVLGCIYSDSTSHISATHPSYLCYKFIPIIVLIGVSDVTGDNESVKSTPVTCMYPLTTFPEFIWINPSGSSLLLNTHLTGTVFIPFSFAILIFVVINAFIDRKLLTSSIA